MDNAEALGLEAHNLVVIMVLERYRWRKDDEAYPSAATLRKAARLSEGQLKRSTGRLVKLGFVERRRSRGPNGQLESSRYRLEAGWGKLAAMAGGSAGLQPCLAERLA